jgi:hypothetical protein
LHIGVNDMSRKARKKSDWEYEPEAHTASKWTMSQFNEDYWSIKGLLTTPSDGLTRDEVMGVASRDEASRPEQVPWHVCGIACASPRRHTAVQK